MSIYLRERKRVCDFLQRYEAVGVKERAKWVEKRIMMKEKLKDQSILNW